MNWDKYKRYMIGAALAALFIILYLAKSVSAVNHAVRAFDDAYFASLEQKEGDTINLCSIPGYIEMIREKAFLSSQVRMADSDSIGLLINIRDSVLQLLIKGVPIRSVRIDEYDVSPFFERANQEAVYSMLSSPLTITGMQATFRKDPVQVKIAPRDTSEAKIDAKPDTTDFEAVFFTLDTDRDIRFYFEQQEDTVGADRRARFFFDLKDRARNTSATMRTFVRLKNPPYTPYVKIWIPKAEAKIIYRAIPREGMIVLTHANRGPGRAGEVAQPNKRLGELLFTKNAVQIAELIKYLKENDDVERLHNEFYQRTEDPLKMK
ncbi:MAG: hypothetical protein LC630_02515 [Bacteroidales bacterium]|nr:hypothetical protein [Bacteroidales bacterium]